MIRSSCVARPFPNDAGSLWEQLGSCSGAARPCRRQSPGARGWSPPNRAGGAPISPVTAQRPGRAVLAWYGQFLALGGARLGATSVIYTHEAPGSRLFPRLPRLSPPGVPCLPPGLVINGRRHYQAVARCRPTRRLTAIWRCLRGASFIGAAPRQLFVLVTLWVCPHWFHTHSPLLYVHLPTPRSTRL